MKINYLFSFFIILIFFSTNSYSQGRIVIEGSVIDEYNMKVPFAAVGIIKRNKVELESIFKVSLENQFKYSN